MTSQPDDTTGDEVDQDAEATTTAPPGGSPTDQEQIDEERAKED
jgi:hypothetical protein